MSGTMKHKKAMGFAATAAVALTMVSAGGANAVGSRGVADQVHPGSALAGATSPSTVVRSARVAEAAAVASTCTYQSYAPSTIVLGASTVKSTFSVKVADCELGEWYVGVYPFQNDDPEDMTGIASYQTPTISLSPRSLSNADAGKHANAGVAAWAVDDPIDAEPAGAGGLPLTLQRRATFGSTFNASEPVKKGKNITIKATLARINWNGAKSLKYVAYGKAKAQLQFKADGTSTYKTVKTITGASNGKYSTTVKASKTGRWRLFFAGISTTSSATSASDAVKVTS
jgi:hypothetical protein